LKTPRVCTGKLHALHAAGKAGAGAYALAASHPSSITAASTAIDNTTALAQLAHAIFSNTCLRGRAFQLQWQVTSTQSSRNP
jgi:hypothetical protein